MREKKSKLGNTDNALGLLALNPDFLGEFTLKQ